MNNSSGRQVSNLSPLILMSNKKKLVSALKKNQNLGSFNCHDDVRTCQGRRRPAQSGLRAQGHQGHTHKLRHWLMLAPPLFWSSLASQRITSARPRQDNHKCEFWIDISTFEILELNQFLLGKYLWYRFHTFQDTWRWLERDTVWDREARLQSRGGGGQSGHRIRACDQSEDRITWGWPIRKREDGWSQRWEIRQIPVYTAGP